MNTLLLRLPACALGPRSPLVPLPCPDIDLLGRDGRLFLRIHPQAVAAHRQEARAVQEDVSRGGEASSHAFPEPSKPHGFHSPLSAGATSHPSRCHSASRVSLGLLSPGRTTALPAWEILSSPRFPQLDPSRTRPPTSPSRVFPCSAPDAGARDAIAPADREGRPHVPMRGEGRAAAGQDGPPGMLRAGHAGAWGAASAGGQGRAHGAGRETDRDVPPDVRGT